MIKRMTLAAAALLFTSSIVAPAQAATYLFTVTGDYNASFQLDSSPSPDDVFGGVYFTVWDVPGFDDAVFGVADITFYNSSIGGGIAIQDFYLNNTLLLTDGPQLYTGSESAPTFLTGTFALTEYEGSGHYTLTISDLTADVPEPASWAMMVGGFGMVGGAMRSRRKVAVSFA